MTEEKVMSSDELDHSLRYEISEKVGAKSLLKCIQCGVCSSGCTVSQYIDLQPHRVVASLLLGLKDTVLNSNAIWTCSLCHRCTERCPKNVDYSFILALLRNIASKEGRIPKEYSSTVEVISENGFVVPYSGGMKNTIDRRREKMGLPEIIPPKLDEVNYILEETGLGNLIKTKEEKD
ncbi:MAG: CoB--CoM heterodisulfide reductase iron-sulfur subunit C [Promethearchaeota archaeon]|jgi:heterodisulfide reductase subunit C|nr:MAG: CoB--CoM heterodisulfide reductase iron-sulfur subunit C [Candidatus Lokiarchaeota archaeon]